MTSSAPPEPVELAELDEPEGGIYKDEVKLDAVKAARSKLKVAKDRWDDWLLDGMLETDEAKETVVDEVKEAVVDQAKEEVMLTIEEAKKAVVAAVQKALDDKRLGLIIEELKKVIKERLPDPTVLFPHGLMTQFHAVTTCRGVSSNGQGFTSGYSTSPDQGQAIGLFCIWNPTGAFKTLSCNLAKAEKKQGWALSEDAIRKSSEFESVVEVGLAGAGRCSTIIANYRRC